MKVTETEYQATGTEYLALLAKNDCYLVLERSAPAGRLKRDFISIKHGDGRDLELRTPQGFRKSPIELPGPILDAFLQASLVKQDGPEDSNGCITYRLTSDGKARGLS